MDLVAVGGQAAEDLGERGHVVGWVQQAVDAVLHQLHGPPGRAPTTGRPRRIASAVTRPKESIVVGLSATSQRSSSWLGSSVASAQVMWSRARDWAACRSRRAR